VRRAQALTLAGAAAVYAAITVTYALSVPVGSSADELAHLNYARLVSDHAALPGPTVTERQQPPLYYLLSAGLLRLGAAPVALRFLSIALGALTIACVALTVRHLAPRQPWLSVGTGAAMALLPGFQFVSASITDDSVAAAAGALLLLVTTHVALAPAPTRRLLLAVGCSVAVGLLSKETDLPVIIVLAGVVVWRWHHVLTIRDVVPVGVPIVLIAGWWYVRNLVAFHRPLPPLTPLGVPPNKLRTVAQLRAFLTQSLHGLFSPERYQGSPLVLPTGGRILLAALAVALGGLVVAGVVLAARSWTRWDISKRTAVTAYALAAAGAAVFSIGNAVVVVFQPQGRYLLVAATGPVLAAAWAIHRLARDRVTIIAVASACTAAAVTLSVMGLTIARAGTG
jgi:hypothetical protein